MSLKKFSAWLLIVGLVGLGIYGIYAGISSSGSHDSTQERVANSSPTPLNLSSTVSPTATPIALQKANEKDTQKELTQALAETKYITNLVKAYGEIAPITEAVGAINRKIEKDLEDSEQIIPPFPPIKTDNTNSRGRNERNRSTPSIGENTPTAMGATLKKALMEIAKDYRGKIALLYAVDAGYYYSVRALIEGGVDVNAMNTQGQTALTIAKKKGRPEMVKLLSKAGARE
jgi:hypothetical protein